METKLEFTLPSPAKVNRFLRIVGQRKDGYHLLQTMFQFLDFGDEITFRAQSESEIILTPDPLKLPVAQNLIYRAAIALKQAAGISAGASLGVIKNIPLGSGLGGGSSNAATTLIGLNLLWNLRASQTDLLNLGLQLGADVPVFIAGNAAFAQGIGEILTPLAIDEPWLLVLTPSCHVSTVEMYRHQDLTRDSTTLRIEALVNGEFENCLDELGNDFETLVRREYPAVDNAMKWLSNYARARLSGSGASIFACFQSKEQAQLVAEKIPEGMKGFIAKSANVSALTKAVERLAL